VLPHRLQLGAAAFALDVCPPIWHQASQRFGLDQLIIAAGHVRRRTAPGAESLAAEVARLA